MSEIKEDDEVVWTGAVFPMGWVVESLRGDLAWISKGKANQIVPLSALDKVEPKFEVGKTYRPVSSTTLGTVRVTDVQGVWAIGWWNNDSPWTEEQGRRSHWTEVTEEEAAAAADQARKLTEVKISTHCPENYILRNIKDGSSWKISPNGTWIPYDPPKLPF